MKNFLGFSLAAVAALTMTACSKGEEKKGDAAKVVTEQDHRKDGQNQLKGYWVMNNAIPQRVDNTEIPLEFAIEIDGDLGLFVHQFDHETQKTERIALGSMIIVDENQGEISLTEQPYMNWLQPKIKVLCGQSKFCIEKQELLIKDNSIRYANARWTRNRNTNELHLDLFEYSFTHASPAQLSKYGLRSADVSENLLGTAKRQMAMGVQGPTKLTRLFVEPIGGTKTEVPVDTTEPVVCGANKASIPRDIQLFELQKDLSVRLNGSVVEVVNFSRSQVEGDPGTFSFWNPSRCSDTNCSKVTLSILEKELQLEESVDNCFKVYYLYSPIAR